MSDYVGCTDGGCVFGHPGGMHTNGGCKCLYDLPTNRRRVVERALKVVRVQPEIVAALEAAAEAIVERDSGMGGGPNWGRVLGQVRAALALTSEGEGET